MSLRLVNVAKNFHQGDEVLTVLHDLSAQINDGEVIAVLGQSGSGKSTLLSLLAGLDRPTSGEIFVGDQEISRLSERAMTQFRAQSIGIVFQQFHLLPHLTALENVVLPLEILGRESAQSEARAMLESMGLSHRLRHFPRQMSGGECQRVAIARALVVKPRILLADEPSGNLDVETGLKVMDVFFSAVRRNKVTTIVVTHSPEVAEKCDRRLILQSGKLLS